MDFETTTTDTIEQQLLRAEATIAQLRGAQMALLREIDRRQAPMADGCRSLVEWVTGRLDLAPGHGEDVGGGGSPVRMVAVG